MAGNANSGRRQEKPFRDALRMELAALGEDHKALRQVARRLIENASAGDMQAIRELADRVDGKVPQALIGGDDEDNPVRVVGKIELVPISARPPDTAS
jgi:hypothetical protein